MIFIVMSLFDLNTAGILRLIQIKLLYDVITRAESKKDLSTKLSNLTFAHETISKVAYYLVVGGQLP